ncbi:hypothetical protein F5884DRAFT_101401 [Xylogone sp. PMI_703]|nr:hypothetical protein F5884DRAFT_101401 [Xylogone sp. PMI_703]
MLLYNLIKQNTLTLNEVSLLRHVRSREAVAKAAKRCLPKKTPYQGKYDLVGKLNPEAKVRKSAKSLGKGEGEVMSHEDIEEARAKRAAKAAKKGKRKRSGKQQEARNDGNDRFTVNMASSAEDLKKRISEAMEALGKEQQELNDMSGSASSARNKRNKETARSVAEVKEEYERRRAEKGSEHWAYVGEDT